MKPLVYCPLVILLGLAGGGYFFWQRSSKPTTQFKTAEVKRGELLATIPATGTIEPEEVIDVGAQVSARLTEFGNDVNGKEIDYRSVVKKGRVAGQAGYLALPDGSGNR